MKPETEDEKACFKILNDLDHVNYKAQGSITLLMSSILLHCTLLIPIRNLCLPSETRMNVCTGLQIIQWPVSDFSR